MLYQQADDKENSAGNWLRTTLWEQLVAFDFCDIVKEVGMVKPKETTLRSDSEGPEELPSLSRSNPERSHKVIYLTT